MPHYYYCTLELLQPVYDTLTSVYNELIYTKSRLLYNNTYLSEGVDIVRFDNEASNLIEEVYNKVIASLGSAAQLTVPKIKSNFSSFGGTKKWMR